jgi:hypothetical protein
VTVEIDQGQLIVELTPARGQTIRIWEYADGDVMVQETLAPDHDPALVSTRHDGTAQLGLAKYYTAIAGHAADPKIVERLAVKDRELAAALASAPDSTDWEETEALTDANLDALLDSEHSTLSELQPPADAGALIDKDSCGQSNLVYLLDGLAWEASQCEDYVNFPNIVCVSNQETAGSSWRRGNSFQSLAFTQSYCNVSRHRMWTKKRGSLGGITLSLRSDDLVPARHHDVRSWFTSHQQTSFRSLVEHHSGTEQHRVNLAVNLLDD